MKKFLSNRFRRLVVWVVLVCISVGIYVIPAYASFNNPSIPTLCLNCGTTNVKDSGSHSSGSVVDSIKASSPTTTTASTPTTPTSSSDSKPWESDPERGQASFGTKLIGDIVASIAWGLDKAGFTPIDKLVFGEDLASVGVFATNKDGQSEFTAIAPVYWALMTLAWVSLIVVVIVKGFKIARGKSNPRTRASIGEISTDFIVGVALMGFSWFIVSYATEWNISLCQLMLPPEINFSPQGTGDYLMSQFVNLVLVVMSIFINIMYILRKFLLIGAVVMGPFVGLAYAAGNKQAFSIWLSETITNAFMPLSHALVLSLYFRLFAWGKANQIGMMSKWYVPIVCLFFILPISAYFRRLFSSYVGSKMGVNAESESKGAFAGMMGGLAGAAALGGSLLGGVKAGKVKGTSSSGNLGKAGDGGSAGGAMSMSTANAGAMQRSSSPSAINTGIGQSSGFDGSNPKAQLYSSKGIETMQGAIGKGYGAMSKAGGFLGRIAGTAAGAAIDTGVMAVTGRDMGMRKTLGNAGGAIGGFAGGAVGGLGGAGVGAFNATRKERKNSGNSEQKWNQGWMPAFQRTMGLNQTGTSPVQQMRQSGASHRLAGTVMGATLGQQASKVAGERGGQYGMRRAEKGLERMGNLKKR